MAATFKEMQESLAKARQEREIGQELIDYLDREFMPVNGSAPKHRMLVTEDKTEVPQTVIDDFIQNVLTPLVEDRMKAIHEIQNSILQPPQPQKEEKPKAEKKAKKGKELP